MANVYISGLTSGQYIAWSGGTKIVNFGDGGAIISNNAGTARLTLDASGNCTLKGSEIISGDSLNIRNNSAHIKMGTSEDVFIYRDGAGILAQRNSTNAQAFRVYNTYTGSADEWLSMLWSSNTAYLIVQKNGTGSARNMIIGPADAASLSLFTNGSSRWTVNSSGTFVAATDNTYDIGSNGALRPRDMYLGRMVYYGVTASITASTTKTQGQGALTTAINEVSTVANANDTVTLPTAVAGARVTIINNGANTLQIFPASGDNLGAGVNTATTLATATNRTYIAYDATNWEIE